MSKNLLQKITASLLFLLFLVSFESKAQDCTTLYLSEGFSGKIYSITPGTGAKVLVTTLASSGQNLAVGPDPSSLPTTVFTSSFTPAGSQVYKGATPTGATLPIIITGLATRTSNGFVYGVSATTRELVEINATTATNLGIVTGDAYFNGATLSTDGFFNSAGELYVIAVNGNFVYLYKINVTTRVATQVVQVAGKLPGTFNGGIAFFNNNVYIASFLTKPGTFGNPDAYFAEIFQLNPLTGISTKVSEVDLGVTSFQSAPFAIDLATCQNFTQPAPVPNCNSLYGGIATNGQIHLIVPAAVATTPPTTSLVTTAAANQGNLAVGPDPANLNSIRYTTSQNAAVGPIYTGLTTMTNTGQQWGPAAANAPIGIATRTTNGIAYGINSKNLTQWTGTGAATLLGAITSASAIWNTADNTNANGFHLNDIAVDAPGNLYCVIMQGTVLTATTVHLFRVDPVTRVATLVISSAAGALMGTAGTSANGNGIAYLNDGFYISRNNGTWTELWKMDATTGAITQVAVGTGKIPALAMGDLASCVTVTKIQAAFTFNCGGATLQSDLYSTGVAQNSTIRVPITGAVSGQAQFTVTSSGGDITANPQPYTATILNGDTFVDIPITYTGAAPSGSRTLTVTTNVAGAGTCNFNINICDGAAATMTVTQPTCAVPSGTLTVTSPLGATIEYSINGGTTFQSSTTFSGLAPGSYPFVRRDTSTGCSFLSPNFTVNAIPPTPPAPTTASVTQPTCAVPTGTIVFNTQAGYEYSVNNGTTYQAGTTFSGLAPGTYTLRVRSLTDNTCTTAGASTVTINAVPTAPTIPTTSSVTQPTCAVPTGTIVFNAQAGMEYSVNGGTTYQASNTFSGLAPGNYNLAIRNTADSTCSAVGASAVTINAVPIAPAAPTTASVTQPTCAVPSGTIVFNT
ncbi:MAG: hypothetical protein V4548_07550, partial [Bacteroidota bacterium]